MSDRYMDMYVCRHCGCDEDHACMIPNPDNPHAAIPCSWWNAEKTVCNNPDCIKKETR